VIVPNGRATPCAAAGSSRLIWHSSVGTTKTSSPPFSPLLRRRMRRPISSKGRPDLPMRSRSIIDSGIRIGRRLWSRTMEPDPLPSLDFRNFSRATRISDRLLIDVLTLYFSSI
jgi:hypothetical protein